MKIQVIKVDVENKGKYFAANVAYKDLENGKVTAKSLVSFNNKEVYNTLSKAKVDDVFNIGLTKNDKGYWDWTSVGNDTTSAPSVVQRATTAVKSSYETPEERAQRQVYIIRQSSLANAIETLKTDKKAPTVDEVIAVANQYVNFVFGNNTGTTPLSDLPVLDDDFPE